MLSRSYFAIQITILKEKPYNQKSDIWSLGCILYETLSLRHAFDSTSMKGLILKILKGTYPPIPEQYSQDLKDLIGELLQSDPKNRPSIQKILEKPFLQLIQYKKKRISSALAPSIQQTIQNSNQTGKDNKKQYSQSFIINSDSNNEKQQQSQINQKINNQIKPLNQINNFNKPNIQLQSNKENEQNKKPNIIINCYSSQNGMKKNLSFDNKENKSGNTKNDKQKLLPPKQKNDIKLSKDQDFGENDNQRVYQKFLIEEGKEVPGTNSQDSLSYRIELLRIYLEKNIGVASFYKAYKFLTQNSEIDKEIEDNPKVVELLGTKNIKFLPLIYQMIVCEEKFFDNSNK